MNDLIRVIETAYDFNALDEQAWLGRVADAVRSQPGFGESLVALSFDVQAAGWVAPRSLVRMGTARDFTADLLGPYCRDPPPGRPPMSSETQVGLAATYTRSGVSMATKALGAAARRDPELLANYRRVLGERGFVDAIMINATDPTRMGCMFLAPVRTTPSVTGRHAVRYNRLAVHIAAGFRLYRALTRDDAGGAAPEGEAVLEPSGKVAHAAGPATTTTARAELRQAAVAVDRARGAMRHRDPEQAVTIWRGLVAGRWSLVDRFDKDGRRYLIAHKNDAESPDPRALTPRERQVVAFAALGQSNKLIAYGLGISPSTVGVLLQRAMTKLGVLSRTELITSLPHRLNA